MPSENVSTAWATGERARMKADGRAEMHTGLSTEVVVSVGVDVSITTAIGSLSAADTMELNAGVMTCPRPTHEGTRARHVFGEAGDTA
jgi:hypothetical protein